MRGSPSFDKRGSPNNQYMHSRYNPQQDVLNQCYQQGEPSYQERPTSTFNAFQGNQGNSEGTNSHVYIKFYINQNQANIS